MFSQAKRYIREVGRSERDKVGGERKKDGEYEGTGKEIIENQRGMERNEEGVVIIN